MREGEEKKKIRQEDKRMEKKSERGGKVKSRRIINNKQK